MSEVDQLKSVVNESSELSRLGENQKALKLLDDSIAQAMRENRSRWVQVLSRHAAVISDQMGDLGLARNYREQCLACDPDDPLALYTLADVLSRQGHPDLAKDYAVKSYQLAANSEEEDDRALIELIAKRWPEIRRRSLDR